MGTKRNVVEEIIEQKARAYYQHSSFLISAEMANLSNLFSKLEDRTSSLIEYFPVAVVACIQNAFRLKVKEIVDFGHPYLSRAGNISKDIRFDLGVFAELQGQKISIGEFFSHVISFSNFDQLNIIMSKLIDANFIEILSSVYDRWDVEIEGKQKTPIIVDKKSIFESVKRVYFLRNMICHEASSEIRTDYAEIKKLFKDTQLFLKATDELIWNLLYPNSPLTQTAMNIKAANDLQEIKRDNQQLVSEVGKLLSNEEKMAFKKACNSRQKSIEDWANFAADQYKGGTIRPLIYGTTASQNQKIFNDQLVEFIRRRRGETYNTIH